MSEWSKEHAWKVCIPQKGIKGSNPFSSATSNTKMPERHFVGRISGVGIYSDRQSIRPIKNFQFSVLPLAGPAGRPGKNKSRSDAVNPFSTGRPGITERMRHNPEKMGRPGKNKSRSDAVNPFSTGRPGITERMRRNPEKRRGQEKTSRAATQLIPLGKPKARTNRSQKRRTPRRNNNKNK